MEKVKLPAGTRVLDLSDKIKDAQGRKVSRPRFVGHAHGKFDSSKEVETELPERVLKKLRRVGIPLEDATSGTRGRVAVKGKR